MPESTMNTTPAIVVWSKPACVQCNATKRKLNAAGLAYQEYDLTGHPEQAAKFREAGYATAPVVVTNLGTWAGYHPEHIKTLQGAA